MIESILACAAGCRRRRRRSAVPSGYWAYGTLHINCVYSWTPPHTRGEVYLPPSPSTPGLRHCRRPTPTDLRLEHPGLSVFGPVFWPILDAILDPFGLHFGTQNRRKTHDFQTCFLDRFRGTFFMNLGAPARPPNLKNHCFP